MMSSVEHTRWLASKGLMTVQAAATFLATSCDEVHRLMDGGHLSVSWFSEEPRVSRAEVEQFAAVTFAVGKPANNRRAMQPVEPFERPDTDDEASQLS